MSDLALCYGDRVKSLYVWCSIGCLLSGSEASAIGLPAASHVVHVSVDGLAGIQLREIMMNAPEEFPAFWQLVTNGASTFNARCDFDDSITMPNHTCMFTGRPVMQPPGMPETTHHGFMWNADDGFGTLHTYGNPALSYQASVFDVAHDHGLSTALLGGKAKFVFYARTWDEQNGGEDVTGADNGRGKIDFTEFTETSTNPPTYYMSGPLVDALLPGLTNAGWNYSFIHFAETDSHGHVHGWGSAEWSNAVRHVDFQLGRILQAILSHPALSNSTAVVLTSDHGGNGFLGHGFPDDRLTYTIPLFLWGAGIPAGTDIYTLFANRTDPGPDRIDYLSPQQPLRNGDSGNLALVLLGLPSIPGSMMRPEFVSLSFRLAIEASNGAVTVSWPAAAAEYVLEAADRCEPDANWQPIESGITLIGPRFVYSLPANSPPASFFRLRK